MGSIASYEYPEHEIETAVDITESIYDMSISRPELLAEELGHSSAEGGAFRSKLTSLRRYGLTTGRGDIELSSLAKRIVAPKPNSDERRESIADAVLNIELLNLLYKRLDYETPNSEFWYHLVEITDAGRSEAQKKADDIQSLYESGLKYVDTKRKNSESIQPESSSGSTPGMTVPGGQVKASTQSNTVPDNAEATLITPDARIDIRSRATFLAAKALFEDIGKKYDHTTDENDPKREPEQNSGITDFY